MTEPATEVHRHTLLRLMAEAPCCETTARKALIHGPQALRGCTRDRVRAAMERLGLIVTSQQESTAAQ